MTTGEVEKKLKSIKKLDKAIHNLDLKISNQKLRYGKVCTYFVNNIKLNNHI